ncbi:hypothetical protein E1301_Tti003094 [Triplophysa tibetana]|uniref:Uncharacterized protein n=1 Tax=Triplophysa tibetana TaxID=1572043 RepID=A0A5A9PRX8_9TELE|nr:hypothetical protein E1301_Tti003094 [Triplophysa tibetana]
MGKPDLQLSRRDANIQRLQQDLLLSHQAHDAQSAQLDFQEQRLWDLQRELRESRQEHQRQHSRNQQLREDARQQDETLQAQAHERVQQQEEELSRLKFQHSSVSQQLWDRLYPCGGRLTVTLTPGGSNQLCSVHYLWAAEEVGVSGYLHAILQLFKPPRPPSPPFSGGGELGAGECRMIA